MKLSTLNGKLKLGSVSQNAKTIKSDAIGNSYTYIIYLAPSNVSGYEVCNGKSEGCSNACLGWYAGRSRFSNVQQARIRKTKMYFEEPEVFKDTLRKDLRLFRSFCIEHDRKPYVRINGSSDIPIEGLGILEEFKDLLFYDYTKIKDRVFKELPSNYKLTFSRDERLTDEEILELMPYVNVAIVFDEIPDTYLGIEVINGDLTDLRYEDPRGVIVGLKAKGSAKKDSSGFVVKKGTINYIPIVELVA